MTMYHNKEEIEQWENEFELNIITEIDIEEMYQNFLKEHPEEKEMI